MLCLCSIVRLFPPLSICCQPLSILLVLSVGKRTFFFLHTNTNTLITFSSSQLNKQINKVERQRHEKAKAKANAKARETWRGWPFYFSSCWQCSRFISFWMLSVQLLASFSLYTGLVRTLACSFLGLWLYIISPKARPIIPLKRIQGSSLLALMEGLMCWRCRLGSNDATFTQFFAIFFEEMKRGLNGRMQIPATGKHMDPLSEIRNDHAAWVKIEPFLLIPHTRYHAGNSTRRYHFFILSLNMNKMRCARQLFSTSWEKYVL